MTCELRATPLNLPIRYCAVCRWLCYVTWTISSFSDVHLPVSEDLAYSTPQTILKVFYLRDEVSKLPCPVNTRYACLDLSSPSRPLLIYPAYFDKVLRPLKGTDLRTARYLNTLSRIAFNRADGHYSQHPSSHRRRYLHFNFICMQCLASLFLVPRCLFRYASSGRPLGLRLGRIQAFSVES